MEGQPSVVDDGLNVARILEGLNGPQELAVTSDAPVLQILAPPGSGKTRTLTSRVAWMLQRGMNPSNIIVATFTVKASKEMKERIGKMIGGGLERRLILGTFHSIARRYLAKYGHLIGIPKGFGIADTSDSQAILARLIKRNNYSTIEGKDASNVRSRISNLKAKMQTLDMYLAAQKKTANNDEFGKIYDQYEKELKNSNLLDYDDLLLRCLDLLRGHPLCVSNIEAVLIDEFQDTNLVQFDLMCLLAQKRNNITIVGDPDQSIYGFRAAEIGNLNTMQQVFPETLVINLEENYRSAAAILQCALEVIEQDKARPQKGITPTHEIGKSPVLRRLLSPELEAQWMVQEIIRLRALTGNLFKFDDISVLVRSASLARVIEKHLNNSAIPYRLIAGTKFFEKAEIKPILEYLRVIVDPNNNEALAKVVNVPPRGLGAKSVEGLVAESHKRGISIWTLINKGVRGELKFQTESIKTKAENGLVKFIKAIKEAQALLNSPKYAEDPNIAPVIEFILEKIEYRNWIRDPADPEEDKWQQVEGLITQATEFCQNLAEGIDEDELPESDAEGNPIEESKMAVALGKFLANAALATVKEDKNAAEEQVGNGVVTISTIHNAKGLEWPIVFVPGCYEGSIPHSRAEDTDEERRLLYVAMTRAQALLYLSYPCELRDRKSGEKQDSNLCHFLSEDNLKPMLASTGPPITPSVVQSLSKIMARECPTEQQIADVKRAAKLEYETDYLPLSDNMEWGDGYEASGSLSSRTQSWATSSHGFMGPKLLRQQSSSTTYSTVYNTTGVSMHKTTMNSGFSTHSTTMQGFKSANSHLQTLATSQKECEADNRKSTLLKRKSDGISMDDTGSQNFQAKASKPKVEKSSKRQDAKKPQNNLMNYFKKPAEALPPPRPAEPNTLKPTSGNKPSQKEVKKKEKYILLTSSSPEPVAPNSELLARNRQLQQEMRSHPPISKFTSVSTIISNSYSAPTTMSRMAARSSEPSSSASSSTVSTSASSAPRKTLGMRRSMNGWNDRHGANKKPN